ncbi:MAG: hypothetical protein ABFS17_09610 [Chloroflexota bacterium]
MNSKQTVESSTPEGEHDEFDVSVPAGDQPTSQPEHQPESDQNTGRAASPVPEALRELIRKEIERRFQSAKDRRWSQLERQYGELREHTEDQGQPLPHEDDEGPQLSPEDRVLEQAEALLTRLGLRGTPQAEALLEQREALEGRGGYLDAIDQVLEIILKRAVGIGAAAPSPAGVVAPSGGSIAKNDLGEQYQARKAEIRPGDVHNLTKLKREFREKGLNIF